MSLCNGQRQCINIFWTLDDRVLVGKPEGKRPLGRPRRRLVDNTRTETLDKSRQCVIRSSIYRHQNPLQLTPLYHFTVLFINVHFNIISTTYIGSSNWSRHFAFRLNQQFKVWGRRNPWGCTKSQNFLHLTVKLISILNCLFYFIVLLR